MKKIEVMGNDLHSISLVRNRKLMRLNQVCNLIDEVIKMLYENLKIGENIKRLRIKKNLEVFEVAIQSNISQSHMYQLETGATRMSIDLLFKLMDILDTDANTILGVEPHSGSIDKEVMSLRPEISDKLIPLIKTLISQVKTASNYLDS